MKIFPVLSVCLVQLLAARVAAGGLFVEFNQDLTVDLNNVDLENEALPHGNQSLVLVANADEPTLSDKDAFISSHPGAELPWETEGQVDLPPLAQEATPDESTPGESTPGESTPGESTPGESSPVSLELMVARRKLFASTVATLSSTVPCSNTDSTPSAPVVRVMVLISDCAQSSFQFIEAWVDNLETEDSRYFARGAQSKIRYVNRYVNECNTQLSGGRQRLNPNAAAPANVIGAIGFVTGPSSKATITSYVSSKNIPQYIGFQNQNWVSTLYSGYRFYSSAATLNAYNPYSVVRALHCANLPNAVPTSFVDAQGKRQCYCSCPTGYALQNNRCVAVPEQTCYCAWDKELSGFTFEVKQGETAKYQAADGTCLIKNLATLSVLPVPVAIDNYVAHDRENQGDSAITTDSSAPHLELQRKKQTVSVVKLGETTIEQGDSNGFTSYYTWRDFVRSSAAKVNAVELASVGKYKVELKAKDYSSNEATCEACVVVVDSRRPTINPEYTCPASVDGCTTDALSAANLVAAQATTNQVAAVKANALNDPCSPNTRCDEDTFKVKAFTATAYPSTATQSHTGLGDVFSASTVKNDLVAKLSGSPFDSSSSGIASSVQDVCSRCVTVTTQLKEWWTPYACVNTPVTSSCSGLQSAGCNYEVCVKVDGDTIATTTATVKPTIRATSKTVVSKLNGDENTNDATLAAKYSLGTSVHVALECSEFLPPAPVGGLLLGDDADGQITTDVCTYTSRVADLFDTTTTRSTVTADALFVSDAEVSQYVSWRYRIDGGSWQSWTTSSAETFRKAESVITVQAWTKCGRVETYTFKVVLHLNNKIRVCDHFSKMWYQTTAPPQLASPNSFCMFPKSDFAEVTFDYHPNIGLDFDTARFQMSISRVKCTMNYEGGAAVTVVDTDSLPAQDKTYEIVKQFAIDGAGMVPPFTSTGTSGLGWGDGAQTPFAIAPSSGDIAVVAVKVRFDFIAAISTYSLDEYNALSPSALNGYQLFVLNPNEYITAVAYRTGWWTDRLQFITNQRSSPTYGGLGGNPGTFQPPAGHKVRGFFGTIGSQYIGSIGILSAPISSPTTKENTKVSISCDFTYTRQPDTTTVLHTCPLDIVITDCSPPLISKPCALDGKCDLNKCSIARNGKPDLYQSCGGNRVRQGVDGSTTLVTNQATCCDSCTSSFSPTCVAIEEFPTGATSRYDAIKRCEPIALPGPQQLMTSAEELESDTQEHVIYTAIAASAMVAVVAVVVVVRRRAHRTKAMLEEDAYYPLMG